MAVGFGAATSAMATTTAASGVQPVTVATPSGTSAREPSSYTFYGISNNSNRVVVFRMTGVDAASPILTAPAFTNGSTNATAWVAPSVAWASGSMLLSGWTRNAASGTVSTASGMTLPTNGKQAPTGNVTIQMTYQAYTSGATSGTRTATSSANTTYAAFSMALRTAGTASTDLLVAFHSVNPDGDLATMTAPAGWIEQGSVAAATSEVKVYTKIPGQSTADFFPFFGA